jgi:hypothetical protein
MQKILTVFLVSMLISFTLHAQRITFSLNAAGNVYSLPEYKSDLYLINHLILDPNYELQNAVPYELTKLMGTVADYQPTSKVGFTIEAEAKLDLGKNWAYSFSVGFSKVRLDIDTKFKFIEIQETKLSQLLSKHGETSYSFLDVRPVNISSFFFGNKLNFQIGCLMEYVLKQDYYNGIMGEYIPENLPEGVEKIQRAFVKTGLEMPNLLFGYHLKAEYQLNSYLSLYMAYRQVFYSPEDQENKTFPEMTTHFHPYQIQTGIGFNFSNWFLK